MIELRFKFLLIGLTYYTDMDTIHFSNFVSLSKNRDTNFYLAL